MNQTAVWKSLQRVLLCNKRLPRLWKGYRPSYAWCSILFGRELLKKGLIKSVGDGQNTRVWSEKWILDPLPRRPVNKQSLIDLKLRLSQLIDNVGTGDMNCLKTYFR